MVPRRMRGFLAGRIERKGEPWATGSRRGAADVAEDVLLARGALAAGAVAAAPLLGADRALSGVGKGELNLVGLDHVGLTVPNIAQAIEWYEDILGAVAPLTFGPFEGAFLEGALNVVPGTKIDQITTLRVGHSANIELFQYESPGQRQTEPHNSDWTGHHFAFYVTDIQAAIDYMDSRGVTRMFGPFTLTDGPAAGQSINYFRTPWGSYIEFISYPKGMAYQVPGVHPLSSPKLNGLDSVVTKVPGLLGIDHIGITVPDIDAAAAWLEQNLGMTNPLTLGPFSDPVGNFMTALVDVDPRAVVEQIGCSAAVTAQASSCSSTPRPTRTRRRGGTPTGVATTLRSTSVTSTKTPTTSSGERVENATGR